MKIKITLAELRLMVEQMEQAAKECGGVEFVILDTADVDQDKWDTPFYVSAIQPDSKHETRRNCKYCLGEVVSFGDMTEQGALRIVNELKSLSSYNQTFDCYELPGDLVGEVIYFLIGSHPDGWNHPFIKEVCSDMIVFNINGERIAFA